MRRALKSYLKKASPLQLAAGMLVSVAFVLLLAPFVRLPSRPRVEITLFSPPLPMRMNEVFLISSGSNAPSNTHTQACFQAVLECRNPSRSALVFAYPRYMLEIRKTNSTEWLTISRPAPGGILPAPYFIAPSLEAGDSVQDTLLIPADAAQWRVHCTYRCWFKPREILRAYLRHFFQHDIGDKYYTAQSATWNLQRSP